MVMILNKCFGGFHLPADFCDAYGFRTYDDIARDDARLVAYVLDRGVIKDGCATLVPVAIPDYATDWEVNEYDGMESVTYVVDGKLYHA